MTKLLMGNEAIALGALRAGVQLVSGYPGTSAESTVVLADAELQRQIQQEYPQMWQRMQARRTYLKETLNIQLSEDVLPMCSTVAYLRPFLLNKDSVLVAE